MKTCLKQGISYKQTGEKALIELKNIKKSYGDSTIINDLSFRFESGKLYLIKGVSGCGKTTLLNVISGVDKDYEGEVAVCGKDGMPEKMEKMSVGYIFQQSLLVKTLTARENLLLISGDEMAIEDLSKAFGVYELLDRFPHQLSGGERQRMSVIRALLMKPSLVLCDEPTASLDEDNSKNMAALLAGLKEDGRVMIIATHDPYFDDYADVIIELSYGEISEIVVRENGKKETKRNKKKEVSEKGKKLSPFRYYFRKDSRFFVSGALLPIVFTMLLVLSISSLRHNFGREYIRLLSADWPQDMIVLDKNRINDIPYREKIVFYENYQIDEEGIKALYLAEKNASVFSVPGMIEYGHFPENGEQVIVSAEAFRQLFSGSKPEDMIGEKFDFAGRTFSIGGVLASYEGETEKNAQMDSYYRHAGTGNYIFIPYDTIKDMGNIKADDYVMACYPGLADHPDIHEKLNDYEHNEINPFFANAETAKALINRVTVFVTALLCVAIVIACLFLQFNIMAELSYRKKEFGYLLLFGVKKKQLESLIMAEYRMKIAAGFVWTILLYIAALVAYRIFVGGWAPADLSYIIPLLLFFISCYVGSARICIRRYMKKSIMELIALA